MRGAVTTTFKLQNFSIIFLIPSSLALGATEWRTHAEQQLQTVHSTDFKNPFDNQLYLITKGDVSLEHRTARTRLTIPIYAQYQRGFKSDDSTQNGYGLGLSLDGSLATSRTNRVFFQQGNSLYRSFYFAPGASATNFISTSWQNASSNTYIRTHYGLIGDSFQATEQVNMLVQLQSWQVHQGVHFSSTHRIRKGEEVLLRSRFQSSPITEWMASSNFQKIEISNRDGVTESFRNVHVTVGLQHKLDDPLTVFGSASRVFFLSHSERVPIPFLFANGGARYQAPRLSANALAELAFEPASPGVRQTVQLNSSYEFTRNWFVDGFTGYQLLKVARSEAQGPANTQREARIAGGVRQQFNRQWNWGQRTEFVRTMIEPDTDRASYSVIFSFYIDWREIL